MIPGSSPRRSTCLLYTSDAADDLIGLDLGGRRILKKKKMNIHERVIGVYIVHRYDLFAT